MYKMFHLIIVQGLEDYKGSFAILDITCSFTMSGMTHT